MSCLPTHEMMVCTKHDQPIFRPHMLRHRSRSGVQALGQGLMFLRDGWLWDVFNILNGFGSFLEWLGDVQTESFGTAVTSSIIQIEQVAMEISTLVAGNWTCTVSSVLVQRSRRILCIAFAGPMRILRDSCGHVVWISWSRSCREDLVMILSRSWWILSRGPCMMPKCAAQVKRTVDRSWQIIEYRWHVFCCYHMNMCIGAFWEPPGTDRGSGDFAILATPRCAGGATGWFNGLNPGHANAGLMMNCFNFWQIHPDVSFFGAEF